jgi:hypothetical protein
MMRQRTAIATGDELQPVYLCSRDYPRKELHRSSIYWGVSARASEGGAMTSVTRPDGSFS